MNDLRELIKKSSLKRNELKQVIYKVLLKSNDMLKVKAMADKVLDGKLDILNDVERDRLIQELGGTVIEKPIIEPVIEKSVVKNKDDLEVKELKAKLALLEKELKNKDDQIKKFKKILKITEEKPIIVNDDDINELYLSLLTDDNITIVGSAFAVKVINEWVLPKTYYKVEGGNT